jgi:hypothetical protein
VYLIGQTLNFKGYYIIGIQDHLLERVLVSGQKIKKFVSDFPSFVNLCQREGNVLLSVLEPSGSSFHLVSGFYELWFVIFFFFLSKQFFKKAQIP